MTKTVIARLQKLFWGYGVFVLIVMIATLSYGIYTYVNQLSAVLFTRNSPVRAYEIISFGVTLSGGVAEAYLAFLMSQVMLMILARKPIEAARTELYLKVACLGYLSSGVFKILFLLSTMQMRLVPPSETMMGYASVALMLGSSVLTGLMPFIYALTIYILYKHFSSLVSFESEVV